MGSAKKKFAERAAKVHWNKVVAGVLLLLSVAFAIVGALMYTADLGLAQFECKVMNISEFFFEIMESETNEWKQLLENEFVGRAREIRFYALQETPLRAISRFGPFW